jgi:16S rRNA (guanine966-N2)-methyltransferase
MLLATAAGGRQAFMRITGGKLRGRRLVAPPDARVRPTSDRTRQAIFNILAHRDFGTGFALAGAAVADLFAGTGALGIEAISHGARFCLFVDDNPDSRALARENVEELGLTGITKIWRRDATGLGPMTGGSGGPFDLAFLDPPYRKNLVAPCLKSLAEGGWLKPGALVVVETDAKETFDAPDFAVLETRTYGETGITLLTPA